MMWTGCNRTITVAVSKSMKPLYCCHIVSVFRQSLLLLSYLNLVASELKPQIQHVFNRLYLGDQIFQHYIKKCRLAQETVSCVTFSHWDFQGLHYSRHTCTLSDLCGYQLPVQHIYQYITKPYKNVKIKK